jgi:hypothetical protein
MINVEDRLNYLDTLMAELARAQVQSEIAFKAWGARIDESNRRMEADTAKMKADITRITDKMEVNSMKGEERITRVMERMETNSVKVEENITRIMERMETNSVKVEENITRIMERVETNSVKGEERINGIMEKMDADTQKMKKAWGDLANKMGTVAEDVVAPNIPRLALEEFGFSEVEDLMVRVRRVSRRGEKRRREWDVVCSGPAKVMVVDVKSTPTLEKIKEVPARLGEFLDFFPEYEGRELIGLFASWSIDPKLLPVISEEGLFGIAMGEDTMEIVARPPVQD